MKKQLKLKVDVARPPEEILRDPVIPLTLEQRVELRAVFKSDAFKRIWSNAKSLAPGPMTGDLNTALGGIIANNRLHEMRGWQMFEAALIKQLGDPVLRAPRPQETFPDSALEIVSR